MDFCSYSENYINDSDIEKKEEKVFTISEENSQGYAGVMRMSRPEFIRKLQKLVNKFDTWLIFYELITGFGRTDDWFAYIKS